VRSAWRNAAVLVLFACALLGATGTYPLQGMVDPSTTNVATIETNGTQRMTTGGVTRTLLSATLGTCTAVLTGAGRVDRVFYANSAAQTGTLTVYDEGASPTCAAGDQVYVSATHGASAVPDDVQIPVTAGIAYKWTTAVEAGNVFLTSN
jgi:hypothetical protein